MLILTLAQYGPYFQYFLSIYSFFIFSTKYAKFCYIFLSAQFFSIRKGILLRFQENPHTKYLLRSLVKQAISNNSFHIQNVSNAVLSGICAFPTLQVTVIITVPFTFPLLLLKNLQALKGILRCPSFMVAW